MYSNDGNSERLEREGEREVERGGERGGRARVGKSERGWVEGGDSEDRKRVGERENTNTNVLFSRPEPLLKGCEHITITYHVMTLDIFSQSWHNYYCLEDSSVQILPLLVKSVLPPPLSVNYVI